METPYSFPRTAPLPPDTEPTERKQRSSNALRASVLDAALQLGFGNSDSKVAKWMFNEGVDEGDEDLDTPPLTSSASTAPSPNTSDAHIYATTAHTADFSPHPAPRPPIFPTRAPLNSRHVRRPSSDPATYIQHIPEPIPPAPSAKPRNKLTKKRTDGYLSEGETLSKKRSNPDLSRAEKKELDKAKARKEKEEKKERKAAKKAAAGGYDTDATDASAKRSRSRDGDYETDDGYQSTGSKKSRSRFFKLGNRSKGEVSRAENAIEVVIPPVPELPPIHPIADKFGLTLSFDAPDDSRSLTPLSAAPSSDTFQSSSTLHAPTPTSGLDSGRSDVSTPPHLSSSSVTSSAVPSILEPSRDSSTETSEEETFTKNRKLPPQIRLPTPNTPFIMRSPQGSPIPMTPPRLHSPMGRVGLPTSPRPTETPTRLNPNSGRRSPMPPSSPHSFDPIHLYAHSDSSTASVTSRSASPASHLHPGYRHNMPTPTISALASTEYIVPSPLPSPRRVSLTQHGLPPPTPPPQSPLPTPPTPEVPAQRPVFVTSPGVVKTRVRSQRYDRPFLPRRIVRSEEGHSSSPSSYVPPQIRRHQSATATPVQPINCEVDVNGDDDALHSPVRDVLSRYSRPEGEETREYGRALARNESTKRTSRPPRPQQQQFLRPPDASVSDDESVYPDEDETGDWDVSYYEESADSHSNSQHSSSNAYYKPSEANIDSHVGKGFGKRGSRALRPNIHHGVVSAGGPKPGWI